MLGIKIFLLISIGVASLVFCADLVSRFMDKRDDLKYEKLKQKSRKY